MRGALVSSFAAVFASAVVLAGFAFASGDGPAKGATAPLSKGTVLVTGANRGLGLEFAKQFEAAGYDVIGTARTPAEAAALRETGARVMQLDVADAASVAAMAKALDGTPIDILINNAGMASRVGSFADMDFDAVARTYAVNTIGPMRVTQALLPNLKAGKRKTVVNITSRLGSLELNQDGGYYGYRESKSALNMFTRSLGAELKPDGFVCIAMSPGWVRTDMGGSQAPLSPEESIGGMMVVIEKLGPDDTMKYFSHDGSILPW